MNDHGRAVHLDQLSIRQGRAGFGKLGHRQVVAEKGTGVKPMRPGTRSQIAEPISVMSLAGLEGLAVAGEALDKVDDERWRSCSHGRENMV
jgi:hypothetical protein